MDLSFFKSVICLLLTTATVSANVCSVSLPSYNETTFNGGSLTSGVQLLVPSWDFSCQGTVDQWTAHIIGDSSIEDSIEFQVFEPDSVNSNIYHVVYGNSYRGNNADGSRITVNTLTEIDNPLLPIRPGYIVGIYISPNVLNKVNLLYEDTGADIDIYYWENVTERTCDFSLCEAKVIRGMTPLVGWIFRNFSNTALSQLQHTVDLLRQNNEYCKNDGDTSVQSSTCIQTSSPAAVMDTSIASITMTTSQTFQAFTTKDIIANITISDGGMLSTTEATNPSIATTTYTSTSHSTSLAMVTTTTSVSLQTPTTTPYVDVSSTSEAKVGATQLQLILIIAVAALLAVCILLSTVLIIVLVAKCVCCSKKRNSETSKNGDDKYPTTNKHVCTGVNPSYRHHSILSMDVVKDHIVDSNKIYEEVQDYCVPEPSVHYYQPDPSVGYYQPEPLPSNNGYCQPEPPPPSNDYCQPDNGYYLPEPPIEKMKIKLHAYDNVGTGRGSYTANTYSHIYEDTNLL